MKNFVLSLFCFLWWNLGCGQGCSDAGICSINKGFEKDSTSFKNTVDISSIYSIGEANIKYLSHYVAYTKTFNSRFAFTGKVTLSTADGEFGTRTQFGDAFLIGNYSFKQKNNRRWSSIVGIKFPFTASNLKINGYSLPLDYQSSLGTVDIFLGSNFQYGNWDLSGAIQVPVVNLNKNSYFREYGGTDDFPSTNLFERQPDILLRAHYSIKTSKAKIIFKPNVLFIYHLGDDSYEDIFGNRVRIDGSQGLTVNGNLLTTYNFDDKNSIELSVAAPFVVRDVRPDGLTRSFVLGLQYRIAF